jgi:hypothetical protein
VHDGVLLSSALGIHRGVVPGGGHLGRAIFKGIGVPDD